MKHDVNIITNANRQYYSEHAGTYDLEEQPFIYQGKLVRSLLRKTVVLSKNEKLLDFGAGTGSATLALSEMYPFSKIHGIDISGEALEIASAKCPKASLEIFDGQKIPFPDNYFDGVIMSSVLHHIFDYLGALQEVCRVCKSHSWVLITQEPNPKISRHINKIRKFLKFNIPELTMKAEYHQFTESGGINQDTISFFFSSQNYSPQIIYSNHALVDILYSKDSAMYFIAKHLFKLIPVFLSYNVLAVRPKHLL